MAGGEIGLKLNKLYPDRYPAKQVQTGLTRARVNAGQYRTCPSHS